MHFLPATNVHGYRHRYQRAADEHHKQHFPYRRTGNFGEDCRTGLKIKQGSTDKRAHNHHRLQTNQPTFIEIPLRHFTPAIVVRVRHHESRQQEKEVYRQITMINNLFKTISTRKSFEYVENNNQDGSHTTQSVKDLVMTFRIGINCKIFHDWWCQGVRVYSAKYINILRLRHLEIPGSVTIKFRTRLATIIIDIQNVN